MEKLTGIILLEIGKHLNTLIYELKQQLPKYMFSKKSVDGKDIEYCSCLSHINSLAKRIRIFSRLLIGEYEITDKDREEILELITKPNGGGDNG